MQVTWLNVTRRSVNGSQAGVDITIQIAKDDGDSLGAMADFAIKGIEAAVAALPPAPAGRPDAVVPPLPSASSRANVQQTIRTEHDARVAAASISRSMPPRIAKAESQGPETP